MAPCTHPGMTRLFGPKANMPSVSSLPRLCLIASRDVNEARRPHTSCRPCEFEEQNSKKTKTIKNTHCPKTHHDIHSSPETATTSIRRATRHVLRVCPYTPASIDPSFVEIGLVQLSQSPISKTGSVASFSGPVSLHQMVQKKERKPDPSPPPAIVTETPKGYPTRSKLQGHVGKSLRPARSYVMVRAWKAGNYLRNR